MKKPGVVEVVTHPVSSVAFAVGLVRGAAVAVLRVAGGPLSAEPTAADEPPPHAVPIARVEPAEQRLPAPANAAFAHEPHSVSAHHSPSRRDEAAVDDWYADAELDADPGAEPAADSVVEALARNDLPGEDQVDHEAIRSVLSESEVLRRHS
jgi:hypothetical protein